MLTQEQVEHYRREGYVVVERLLDPDTLVELRRVVHGEPTLEPRLAPAPVRIPLPAPVYPGSLYENQRTLRHRYFATAEEAEGERGPEAGPAPGQTSGQTSGRERAAASAGAD